MLVPRGDGGLELVAWARALAVAIAVDLGLGLGDFVVAVNPLSLMISTKPNIQKGDACTASW